MNPLKIPSNEHYGTEVNLKILFNKILKNKFFFLFSMLFCLAVAYTYLKIAIPTYLVQTSLLIDSEGKSRSMGGNSKYVDGGVGLIGMEKNLYNEIGIIKSYSLIYKTLKDLDFGISYYAGSWYKKQEFYHNFPFEVVLADSSNQLNSEEFKIEMLPDDKYRLTIETEEFNVYNPKTESSRSVSSEIKFSKIFNFRDTVEHDYFHFVINKLDDYVEGEFSEKELFFKINNLSSIANSYISNLDVKQVDLQSSILAIQTEGEVVAKEVKFLKQLNQNFIDDKLTDRAKTASKKEDFTRDLLGKATRQLSAAELNLETFRSGNGAVDLTKTGAMSLDQLQKLESERGQIELDKQYYTSLLSYIDTQKDIDKAITPSVAGIDDPLLNDNLLELKRLHTQKTQLSFVRGDESYDMKILAKQIANTTSALKENVQSLIATSDIALRNADQKIGKLERTLNQLPGNEKKLINLERKASLSENLYNYLSLELAKNGIARAEDVADVKVLDTPRRIGSGSVASKKALIMALGAMVGLMMPLAWIVFTSGRDETIETPEQLDGRTQLPLVAKIIHATRPIRSFENFASQWAVKESFRDLSANFQFLVANAGKNVIGFTSNTTREGKTFCSLNLGMSLASEGKKVIVLDLNFRNPKLWNSATEFKGTDLTRYLDTNGIDQKEIVYNYQKIPNLYLVNTQKESQNPHKYLNNPKLKTLIESLKVDYDYVIIDSPPVGVVSDYLLISKYIDILLFVVRRNVSKISYVKEIEKLSEKGEMGNTFLVYNDHKEGRFNRREEYAKEPIKAETSKSYLPNKKVPQLGVARMKVQTKRK